MKLKSIYCFIFVLILFVSGCRDHSRHVPEITISEGGDVVTNWITVSKPDYGETWQPGTIHEIQWKSNTEISRVNIDVFKKGSYLYSIMTDLENTGSYTWQVPENATMTNHAKIRVSSTNDGNVEGFSEVFYLVVRP